MAVTVLDVSNIALIKLGQATINSLDDGSTEANLCKIVWGYTYKDILRSYPWNFTIQRKSTSSLSYPPKWGFEYKHELPSDLLRLLDVDGVCADEYQVENNYILCNFDRLNIRYVGDISNPDEYDSSVVNLVAFKMAYEMCEQLTQSGSKKEQLYAGYLQTLNSAKSSDAQENPPILLDRDAWLDARR